jgi:cell division protein FtsA
VAIHIIGNHPSSNDDLPDGQADIRMPIGMHGYRLDVEAYFITAAGLLRTANCVEQAAEVKPVCPEPAASAGSGASETERESHRDIGV